MTQKVTKQIFLRYGTKPKQKKVCGIDLEENTLHVVREVVSIFTVTSENVPPPREERVTVSHLLDDTKAAAGSFHTEGECASQGRTPV